MAEPGRTQLQMLLVQQAGQGALPLSILAQSNFLPFIRTVEQLAVDERLAPVMVYWSKHTAARYVPSGPRFRELLKDAFCVAIFSEDRDEPPDEWCFLIESRGLCLIVYGQQTAESPTADKFQCSGSMDPQIVRQAFNSLLPTWQRVDPAESNRLEDARVNLGPCGSAMPYMQRMRTAWPIVKASPIQQSLILQPTDLNASKDEAFQRDISTLFSESGKIQPIAIEPGGMPGLQGLKYKPYKDNRFPSAPPMPIQQALSALPQFDPAVAASTIPAQEFEIDRTQDDEENGGSIVNDDDELSRRMQQLVEKEDDGRADDQQNVAANAVFPPAAQSIISDIIGQLRHSNDLSSILQFAIETLTTVVGAR